MYLETLLNLIALPPIVLLVFVHIFVVQPALVSHGLEPHGFDSFRVYKDWQRYYCECGGFKLIYFLMWGGIIVLHVAVLLQMAQFFLFPGIRLS